MPIAGDTAIHLAQPLPDLPLEPLVQAWRVADFEPRASRAALVAWMRDFAVPEGWFRPDEVYNGGFVAANDLLFQQSPPDRDWQWTMSSRQQTEPHFSREIPTAFVTRAARITRSLHAFQNAGQFWEAYGESLDSQIHDTVAAALSRVVDYGTWPTPDRIGIYRREHASIAMRSANSLLLFDPQGYTGSWTTGFASYPADRDPRVDAVVITHSHSGHWHLASVLRHCDGQTQVIVPQVPRVNVLAPVDFSAALSTASQKHICLRWRRKIIVGDFEIEALPFCGAQPGKYAREAANAPRISSNCYAVRCSEFSALVLVDGGVDPEGEMQDVVRELVAREGRFDVVISSCGRQAISPELPVFSLAVPFGELREIHSNRSDYHRQRLTAKVAGVAEICAVAQARYFLPYAHGFNGLEEGTIVDGTQTTETMTLAALDMELRRIGANTQIALWWVGNRFPIGGFVLPD